MTDNSDQRRVPMSDKGQIEKLADFIMAEVPGEPSQSEGAGDAAIRIIRSQQKRIEALEAATPAPLELAALRADIGAVLVNASNYPPRVRARVLGQDMGPLIDKVTHAVLAVRRPDPVTPETARDERDAKYFHDGWVTARRAVAAQLSGTVFGEFLVEQLGDPVVQEEGN